MSYIVNNEDKTTKNKKEYISWTGKNENKKDSFINGGHINNAKIYKTKKEAEEIKEYIKNITRYKNVGVRYIRRNKK